MQFHLEDMTCGGCARTVTKTIQMIDPNAKIVTDPPTRRVEVQTSRADKRQSGLRAQHGLVFAHQGVSGLSPKHAALRQI